MAPISIRGMPHEGNPSALLFAVSGFWASSGGLRLRCGVCARRVARAASTPSRAWTALCLPSRVPHDVLTPSWLLLRPPLPTRCAAPSARKCAVRGLHGLRASATVRKEVTMIQPT